MHTGDVAMQLLIEKWAKTGLLKFVKPEHIADVVERLEDAAQLTLLSAASDLERVNVIEQEIIKLRDEGLFGTPKAVS